MDFVNIFYSLFGAIFTFLVFVFERLYSDYLNKKGKLVIYYRKVNMPCSKDQGWGFNEECLYVPLYLDFVNTTNVNKVVRDFSLYLYDNDKMIKKFTNSSKIGGQDEKKFGITTDRYSFVIGPKSVLSVDCMYFIMQSDIKSCESFNRIIVSYFNEKDKNIKYELCKIQYNISNKLFKADEDWKRLIK